MFSMIILPVFEREGGPCIIPPWWLHRAQHAIEDVGRAHARLDRVGWNRHIPRPPEAEPFNLRSVATAIAYIESDQVTRINIPRGSSYALKHSAERWGKRMKFEPYVGNGDFILAALHCDVSLGKAHGSNCAVALHLNTP
jgi:hypothetical protein